MAFAITQRVLRRADDAWRTTGRWTATSGDSAGTVTVPGVVVDMAVFQNNLSSGGPANDPNVSSVPSGAQSVVTVSGFATVTNGSFTIISR